MIKAAPWGFDDVLHCGNGYVARRVYVKEQFKTDFVSFPKRHQTFIVGSDSLVFLETGNDDRNISTGVYLQENDRFEVEPGTWHRISALRDSVVYCFANENEDEPKTSELVLAGKLTEEHFKNLLRNFIHPTGMHILEVQEAAEVAMAARAAGKVIGFCNGCFDLMHLGHAELLLQAKQRCNVLFVAVNVDESVRRLKGNSRPFVDEAGRMGMVLSNRNVDYVIRNEALTCVEACRAVHPDVYIATTEHGDTGPEAKETMTLGGSVVVIDMLPGYKTTRIANLILKGAK